MTTFQSRAGHASIPQVLPQELCGIICQDPCLSRNDLHSLCAVSRAFRDEAERLLYSFAILRGQRKIRSFCMSVIRRPYLAARLNRLLLLMPPQLDFEAADLARLTKALRLCSNLQHLHIHQDNSRALPLATGDSVQHWILLGHPFKLKSFGTSYFQPPVLVHFLMSQPSLETLSIKCKAEGKICDAVLPNLKNLDTSAAVVREFGEPTWRRRRFERLQFNLVDATDTEELETLVAMTEYRSTLKSLSVIRKNGQNGMDIMAMLMCTAAQLPDIKYLRFFDFTNKTETYHIQFLPFPLGFTQLETLVLHPPRKACCNLIEHSVSAFHDLRSEQGRLATATRIMTGMDSLRRLVIVNNKVHEFTKNPEDGKITERELSGLIDETEWLKINV